MLFLMIFVVTVLLLLLSSLLGDGGVGAFRAALAHHWTKQKAISRHFLLLRRCLSFRLLHSGVSLLSLWRINQAFCSTARAQ
jgi:hypothetical protein